MARLEPQLPTVGEAIANSKIRRAGLLMISLVAALCCGTATIAALLLPSLLAGK